MGKIDVTQMKFLRNPEHFADIWNGLVFDGKPIIKPEEIVEISPVGLMDSRDRSVKKTSDIAMAKIASGEILAVMIMENQTEVDYSLPVRVCLREYMEYDKQVAEICKKNREAQKKGQKIFSDSGEYMYGFRKSDRLRPVTTLILSWNDKEWTGAKSLYDLLDFSGSEDLKNLVSDYRMNVVDMDSITNEKDRFTNNEVRDVVSLYLRRNNKAGFKEYVDEYGEGITEDCMKMVNSFVISNELKKYMDDNCNEKGEQDKNMCRAITELIQDGRNEGRKEERLIVNKLISTLLADGRVEDLRRASTDQDYQDNLIKELFPDDWKKLNDLSPVT
ncbi:MAG: hypothetical protein IKP88_18640 [Lachnospiraceae bacterium]|nr:hypothetical protein [Lachnospiraceae bacterium]